MKRSKGVLELERVRPEPFLSAASANTRAYSPLVKRRVYVLVEIVESSAVRTLGSVTLEKSEEGVGFGWIELSVGEVCGELDELEG